MKVKASSDIFFRSHKYGRAKKIKPRDGIRSKTRLDNESGVRPRLEHGRRAILSVGYRIFAPRATSTFHRVKIHEENARHRVRFRFQRGSFGAIRGVPFSGSGTGAGFPQEKPGNRTGSTGFPLEEKGSTITACTDRNSAAASIAARLIGSPAFLLLFLDLP